jgi:hypothetical protein
VVVVVAVVVSVSVDAGAAGDRDSCCNGPCLISCP